MLPSDPVPSAAAVAANSPTDAPAVTASRSAISLGSAALDQLRVQAPEEEGFSAAAASGASVVSQNVLPSCAISLRQSRRTLAQQSQRLENYLRSSPSLCGTAGSGESAVGARKRELPSVSLHTMKPRALAEQLTVLEHQLLFCVSNDEFRAQAWNKGDAAETAPHLLAYIHNFNRISCSFGYLVLEHESAEERGGVLSYLVDVTRYLFKLQNFSGVMQLLSCLHSAAVSRLKRSWECVSGRRLDALRKLTSLFDSNKNFQRYRQLLRRVKPPFLPYLGMWLTDLTFFDERPTFVGRNQVGEVELGMRVCVLCVVCCVLCVYLVRVMHVCLQCAYMCSLIMDISPLCRSSRTTA
jgi:RasGEF domain